MRFDRFTQRAQEAIARSQEILLRYQHTQMDLEHVLLSLVEQPDSAIKEVFDLLGTDLDFLKRRLDDILRAQPRVRGGTFNQMPTQVFITPAVQQLAVLVDQEATRMGDQYISTEHILLGIAAMAEQVRSPLSRLFNEINVTKQDIAEAIEEIRGGAKVTDPNAEIGRASCRERV